MADFLTHILLADAVLKRLESRRISEGITKKRTLYYIGSQGPDPLFFYNCFPGSGKGPLKDLGRLMHREKTGAFLSKGFEKLQNVSYDRNWMDVAVYMCGFICHFTLDRMIHPYVYWAEGQWIWGMDGTPQKTSHERVEASLDVLYWQEVKGRPAYRERTRKLIDIGSNWPEGVADLLRDAFSDLYGIEAGQKELNKILTDFYRGHDLLFDPRGWKKALINWLDSFTGVGIKPPKSPYPVECGTAIDWANRKKRTWVNPFIEQDARKTAVDEILEEAADTAAIHINTIFSRIYKGKSIHDLFPDLSYLTGIPCEYGSEPL